MKWNRSYFFSCFELGIAKTGEEVEFWDLSQGSISTEIYNRRLGEVSRSVADLFGTNTEYLHQLSRKINLSQTSF